jgi:hypothetical protein
MTDPQRKPLFAGRLMAAVAVGLTATVACVAAATEPAGPRSAEVHPLTSADPGPSVEGGAGEASALGEGDSGAPGDGGKPEGGCPNGALEDPHRGFVRCLAQGEKSPIVGGEADAGADADAGDGASPGAGSGNSGGGGNGSGGAGSAPDAGPPAAPAPTPAPTPAPAPGPPPIVEMKAPKFENGDVPKAEKNLSGKKVLDAIAKCVADAGGLTAKTGSLKVELMVRARGKAEGVEVKPQGVSEEAARCVRTFLKNRSVGMPTADPTGVTVVYNLKPAGK